MAPVHPLKRKSVKPSISTVRGMLSAKQFRSLDAAMQSLRTAGLRLDWHWKNKSVGWVSVGLLDERIFCEVQPLGEPLVGYLSLTEQELAHVVEGGSFPKKFARILDLPVEIEKNLRIYEFPLEENEHRDLFSDFIESLIEALSDYSA